MALRRLHFNDYAKLVRKACTHALILEHKEGDQATQGCDSPPPLLGGHKGIGGDLVLGRYYPSYMVSFDSVKC